jgi:sugar transferase (PEP-CTERM system associated)
MIRLFRVFIPASVLVLLLSEILLVTFSFVLACFLVLEVDPSVFLLYDDGISRILLVVATLLLGLYFHDRYTSIRVRSRMLLAQELMQVVGIAFLVQAAVSYFDPELVLPRRVMIVGSTITLLVLLGWRIFYAAVVLRAFGGQKVLFVGANEVVQEIAKHAREHPELGFALMGYVEDAQQDEVPHVGKRLGSLSELKEVVAEVKPDRIVVGMSERRARLPVLDLLDIRFSGVVIEEAASAYESACSRICTKELRPAQLVFSGELGPRPINVLLQLIYSGIIAIVAFLVLLPLMLVVALLVRVSSKGPVLYRQKRVGENGEVFTLYKFRSMYVDAEARTGAVWASKNDPRITAVGRWLRSLRIDELPQLINVLKGEMSIVGPRPERPEFVRVLNERIPYYRQRHAVKPGITGWAQINHKYADTLEDTITKLEYDLYYIKNISPSLDAYIIFHTLKTILLSRGAH